MRRRRTVLSGGVGLLAGSAGSLHAPRRSWLSPAPGGVRIGVLGDVMLGRSVSDRWSDERAAGVWGPTLSGLQSLDGLVLNLECAITDREKPWPNKTFSFRAEPEFATRALQTAGVSAVSLANNHVLDFRQSGLQDTRSYLERAEIAHTGAGPDRSEAFAPAVFDAGGVTVAVLGLTDREPAYEAGEESAGTAYLPLSADRAATRSMVRDALSSARAHDPDLIVASVHWGPNWKIAPSPGQPSFARWLVDEGVDVVHGHSAHVLQGVETYRDGVILYDTADYVDDYISYRDRKGVFNKRSALFTLVVTQGRLSELRIHPVEIESEAVRPAEPAVARWVCQRIRARSHPFKTAVQCVDGYAVVSLDDRPPGVRSTQSG